MQDARQDLVTLGNANVRVSIISNIEYYLYVQVTIQDKYYYIYLSG